MRPPISAAFPRTLGLVWVFPRTNPGLRTDGHNVLLYHHGPDGHLRSPNGLEVDFGVEVVRTFEDAGGARCIETPAGEAALAIHRGSYHDLFATHQAVRAASAAQGRRVGGHSLEIHGAHSDDPARLETEITYLLA